jgi:hypothetical protein
MIATEANLYHCSMATFKTPFRTEAYFASLPQKLTNSLTTMLLVVPELLGHVADALGCADMQTTDAAHCYAELAARASLGSGLTLKPRAKVVEIFIELPRPQRRPRVWYPGLPRILHVPAQECAEPGGLLGGRR